MEPLSTASRDENDAAAMAKLGGFSTSSTELPCDPAIPSWLCTPKDWKHGLEQTLVPPLPAALLTTAKGRKHPSIRERTDG